MNIPLNVLYRHFVKRKVACGFDSMTAIFMPVSAVTDDLS